MSLHRTRLPPAKITIFALGSRAILIKEGDGRVAYGLSTTAGRPQAGVNAGSTTPVVATPATPATPVTSPVIITPPGAPFIPLSSRWPGLPTLV